MPVRVFVVVVASLGSVVFLSACGGISDEQRVEDAVRLRGNVAGPVAAVACVERPTVWGCTVRLRDGRTQACQATVSDGRVRGLACQPLRSE